ncbi:MAG: hypothetical protein KA239_00275 [Bacteroidia bacterium]|nr:hypothetical protein [Bacteroidia bacterium]
MAHFPQSDDQIPAMKWAGIPEMQLEALETRQRHRITALEEMLAAEKLELASIIAARSGKAPFQQGAQFAVQPAPQHYSTELTWKDKILFVVKEAGKPIHGKEIGPALRRLQPHGLKFSDLDNTVSVHLSKLVRDGALVRIKVKGRSGSLYGLPSTRT